MTSPTSKSRHLGVHDGCIRFGRWLTVSFHRTLRIPDDGGSYPLPPSFGRFPLYAGVDYQNRVPNSWSEPDSFFMPLHQGEALWLGFDGEWWHPSALLIGADGVNVITGEPWGAPLAFSPQNYVVIPDQPWLDGIRTRSGLVRQFVAMPLGEEFTLTEQMGGTSGHTGIQLCSYEAKPGRFPDEPPMRVESDVPLVMRSPRGGSTMGIAPGGMIIQKIYPDRYGFDSWESDGTARAKVHIVNSLQFSSITGEAAPPPVISATDYTERGFPWFDLWDEDRSDLGSQSPLEDVKSIGTVATSRGLNCSEPSVQIPQNQVKKIRRPGDPQ
jgi:hypothetical protein